MRRLPPYDLVDAQPTRVWSYKHEAKLTRHEEEAHKRTLHDGCMFGLAAWLFRTISREWLLCRPVAVGGKVRTVIRYKAWRVSLGNRCPGAASRCPAGQCTAVLIALRIGSSYRCAIYNMQRLRCLAPDNDHPLRQIHLRGGKC